MDSKIWRSNNEWRIKSEQLKKIVFLISEELKQDTLEGVQPTIDCFPAVNGRFQRDCDIAVNNKKGFFDLAYNDKSFWAKHVVWAYPQNHRATIVETIRLFRMRNICGYCCIQIWIPNHCATYVHMDKYAFLKQPKRKAKAYVLLGDVAHSENSKLSLMVMFFDFRGQS